MIYANENLFEQLQDRKLALDQGVERVVAELIQAVREQGDRAVLAQVQRFDAPNLDRVEVPSEMIEQAQVAPEVEEAISHAIHQVMKFHEAQLYYLTDSMTEVVRGPSRFEGIEQADFEWEEETDHGGSVGQRLIPLDRVGAYIPGGKAVYPSSVVMNVCPANVALVREVFVATPPAHDGGLAPEILVAARLCHVNRVFRMGGATAVAALALGTETIPRVDKIVGPGNKYVNEAKRQLWGTVGLDGYAGSSEVCVLADAEADAENVAADLLTQIEHAEDNLAFLVTTDDAFAQAVIEEAERQMDGAPREAILRAAWQNAMVLVARDLNEACDLVNQIAPEHLSLALEDPEEALPRIRNAGCILIGEFTPESAGDYVAGPSHTLPTATAVRFGSPVNVMDFLKFQSIIRWTVDDLEANLTALVTLAHREGFPAHGRGASIRFSD